MRKALCRLALWSLNVPARCSGRSRWCKKTQRICKLGDVNCPESKRTVRGAHKKYRLPGWISFQKRTQIAIRRPTVVEKDRTDCIFKPDFLLDTIWLVCIPPRNTDRKELWRQLWAPEYDTRYRSFRWALCELDVLHTTPDSYEFINIVLGNRTWQTYIMSKVGDDDDEEPQLKGLGKFSGAWYIIWICFKS